MVRDNPAVLLLLMSNLPLQMSISSIFSFNLLVSKCPSAGVPAAVVLLLV